MHKNSTQFTAADAVDGFDPSKLKPYRRPGRPKLATHEQEALILKLATDGFSVPSIAESLGLSVNTVRSLVRSKTTKPA